MLVKDLQQDQSLSVPEALQKANEKQTLAQKDGGGRERGSHLAQAYAKDPFQKQGPNSCPLN